MTGSTPTIQATTQPSFSVLSLGHIDPDLLSFAELLALELSTPDIETGQGVDEEIGDILDGVESLRIKYTNPPTTSSPLVRMSTTAEDLMTGTESSTMIGSAQARGDGTWKTDSGMSYLAQQ